MRLLAAAALVFALGAQPAVAATLATIEGDGDIGEWDGAASAVRHIYRKEGVGGFFRGCMANNVRAIASALVLVLYDEAKKYV